MPVYLVIPNCGCAALWKVPDTAIASFITEYSDKIIGSDDYYPFVTEDDTDDFFVPENYDMSTPVKFSETATAPDLNGMSEFVGLQDNGDGTHTNYRFTPQQLVVYVMGSVRKTYNADSDTDSYTDASLIGKDPSMLFLEQQSLIRGLGFSFDSLTGTVTLLGGQTFYEGQLFKIDIY